MVWPRKRPDELESVNLLEVTPVRLAGWEERAGRVVLIRPKSGRRGTMGQVDRLLYLLSAKRIRLDAVGSFVWHRLDGEQTVGKVAELLREEFGDDLNPVEQRLGHLVRVLRREGLVAYRGWDDDVINAR